MVLWRKASARGGHRSFSWFHRYCEFSCPKQEPQRRDGYVVSADLPVFMRRAPQFQPRGAST